MADQPFVLHRTMSTALRRIRDLPGPPGWPVVGNLLQLDAARLHLQLETWARQYGPYMRLRLGSRPAMVVADHKLIAAMLRDRPDGYRRTLRLQEIGQEMGLLTGVFSAEGEAWKRQRRMVMAGFDPAHVRRYHPALLRVAHRLAGRWQRAAASGASIDLQADLMRYTVDAIAGLAFGADVNTLETDGDVIQQHLDKIFPTLFRRMVSPIPTWRWWRTREVRELESSMQAVNLAVQGFIVQTRQRLVSEPLRGEQPQNLLEAMLAAADQPGTGIDDAQVAGNVLTMLLAGEDTTANTLAWMIHLLWQHPAALQRATDEVRSVLDGARLPDVEHMREPTLEQLAALDFVEACAHETMRLKPVAPILGVQALRDGVVGDVAVPAGSLLIGLMRHDAVNDAHVPQAQAFDPQRWLSEPASAVVAVRATHAPGSAKRVSMPFGAGPRMCPGRYIALVEIKLAIAVLLSRFDITHVGTASGQAPIERMSFTMMPVGLTMKLKARAAG